MVSWLQGFAWLLTCNWWERFSRARKTDSMCRIWSFWLGIIFWKIVENGYLEFCEIAASQRIDWRLQFEVHWWLIQLFWQFKVYNVIDLSNHIQEFYQNKSLKVFHMHPMKKGSQILRPKTLAEFYTQKVCVFSYIPLSCFMKKENEWHQINLVQRFSGFLICNRSSSSRKPWIGGSSCIINRPSDDVMLPRTYRFL